MFLKLTPVLFSGEGYYTTLISKKVSIQKVPGSILISATNQYNDDQSHDNRNRANS
jgi:hypothetical protein